jgi:hypothetical protein
MLVTVWRIPLIGLKYAPSRAFPSSRTPHGVDAGANVQPLIGQQVVGDERALLSSDPLISNH